MNSGLLKIYRAFGGKLVGSSRMKHFVCQAVAQLPPRVSRYITRNCWFMGSLEDAWAFTFVGNDLADQHLIFVSDELLRQSPEQIEFTLVHEIGHVILGHRNSIQVNQSRAEIGRQEREADVFARRYVEITRPSRWVKD